MNSTNLTVEEVAHELSVSVATVRNWIKLGRIKNYKKKGKVRIFDYNEIMKIKDDISKGKLHKLQSRRNKKMVSGNLIPKEYVSYEPYLKIINQIIDIGSKIEHKNSVSIILLEIALKFLKSREKIVQRESSNRSLTELYIKNSLDIPTYINTMLNQLVNPSNVTLLDNELNALAEINQLEIPFIIGEDFLGLAYMSLSAAKSRKNSGSYYTPSKVVDFVVSQNFNIVKSKHKPKVIDPCCGSGNFLIKVFLLLKKNLLERGYSTDFAEKEIIENCLYGYDINNTAVTLSSLNLILLMDCITLHIPPQINCRNTLESTPSKEEAESFDWVLGNPPWGYNFSEEEKQQLKERYSIKGEAIESFTLFIQYGSQILNNGGSLTYVLPEAFLNIKAHSKIREKLLLYSTIDMICLLDRAFSNVFTKTISLTLTKQTCKAGHKIKVIESNNIAEIEQTRFLENEFNLLNVNSDIKIFDILDKIKNGRDAFYLTDKVNAEYALGIVTGDNRRYVSNKKDKEAEVILTGKSIYKYNFYKEEKFITFSPEEFQQVAPERLYRAPEKLFYRFVNKNLVFTYDDSQTLSLNSANILIPKYRNYSAKYIMAILNSRVAQFFHTYYFSALKVLKKHIESIPIPLCNKIEQDEVVQLVDLIMNTEDSEKRREIYEKLDQRIMLIYQLDEESQKYIRKTLKEIKYLTK